MRVGAPSKCGIEQTGEQTKEQASAKCRGAVGGREGPRTTATGIAGLEAAHGRYSLHQSQCTLATDVIREARRACCSDGRRWAGRRHNVRFERHSEAQGPENREAILCSHLGMQIVQCLLHAAWFRQISGQRPSWQPHTTSSTALRFAVALRSTVQPSSQEPQRLVRKRQISRPLGFGMENVGRCRDRLCRFRTRFRRPVRGGLATPASRGQVSWELNRRVAAPVNGLGRLASASRAMPAFPAPRSPTTPRPWRSRSSCARTPPSPPHLPHRRLVSGACIAASRVKPAAVCLSSRTIWPRLLGRRQPPSRPSRPPSPLPPGMLPGDRSPTTIRRLGPPPPLTRSRSPAPKRQKG